MSVSQNRRSEPPKLIREVRGDLDWIVMKALEKDRKRRYATTNGLAMDIGRYLSGEAILARPPSATYKFRKLAARNKLLFLGIALTFVLLVISLITTTRWLVIEKRTAPSAFPRATGISLRSMELLRSWGLEARVRELTANSHERAPRASLA